MHDYSSSIVKVVRLTVHVLTPLDALIAAEATVEQVGRFLVALENHLAGIIFYS